MSKEFKRTKDVIQLTCKLELPITSIEAYEVLNNPRGKIAKDLRKYLTDVLNATCKKCLKVAREYEEQQKVNEGA